MKELLRLSKPWLIGIFISMVCSMPNFAQSGTLVTAVEAESGVLAGGANISTAVAGYSGTGYVSNFRNNADKVTVTVNVPTKAFYLITIRYSSPDAKFQDFSVNGGGASSVSFPKSTVFANVDAGKYYLNAGNNTLTIQSSWGWTEIDKFTIYTTVPNTYTNFVSDLVDPKASTAAQSFYSFLLSQFGKKFISGQTAGQYDKLKMLTGKSPVYKVWDFQHYTEGYSYLWKNGGFSFGVDPDDKSTDDAINWYNGTGKKGMVGFQWHWHSPSGGTVGKNTFYTDQTTFDVTKAVQNGTAENTLIIRDIDAIAAQLKKLQTAGVPVLFRPLHEAGGAWFWWGAKGATACKQLYAIIFDRIKNYHQIHNLIWVWSTPEADWYPGNSTVDIVGYDSYPGEYNYGTQKNMFDTYYTLTSGKKIVAMSENGPIPDPDDCLDLDSPWSFFMSWDDLVFKQNTDAHLKAVYANPRVMTLENDTYPMIIDVSPASLCSPGTATLGASANFGTVNWYNSPTGGDPVHTGTSFTTPALSATTTYYVEASDNGNPSELKRSPVIAQIASSMDAATITGTAAVCQGATNVVYTVPANASADAYAWTLPTGATGTSTTNSISVSFGNAALSGNIKVKGHNGCGDGAESTFIVTVNARPATPVITLTNGALQSNASAGNQWYFNNTLLPNTTSSTIPQPQTGNYYVIVTTNGCASSPSNTIAFIPTAIDEAVGNNGIDVYPNPTSNVAVVAVNHRLEADYTVEVYDNVGRLVQSFNKRRTETDFEIDLGKFSAGLYVLHMYTTITHYQTKLIKR
jgi:mannan endo-1,4-beta-mannosidase